MLDWSLDKVRHFYHQAQVRVAKRDLRAELSTLRGVHTGAASIVDKKGQNAYKTKERELVSEINGAPEANPEAAIASVASRLRKSGVTQKYGQRS